MISIRLDLMLAQVLTFLVALFLVWKFGWRPLTDLLKSRRDSIRKALEESERTKKALIKLEEEGQYRLKQIQQEAKSLIDMAKEEGYRERERIVREAQEESQSIRKQMKEHLDEEKKRALRDLRKEIVTLSLRVSEKLMRETVKREVQDRRFDEILDSLEKGK